MPVEYVLIVANFLHIFHPDFPSIVASTTSPHFILVEQQLHLYCSFDGIPDPTVVWIQNGSALNTTEPRINDLTNATYSQLTLGNVTLSDSGLYVCNITNTIGNAQASITVNAVNGMCYKMHFYILYF